MEKIERLVSYSRREDMTRDGRLSVMMEDDGDLIVSCQGYDQGGDLVRASVQFCTIGSGGKSPRVRQALMNLIEAIVEDNGGAP